MSDIKNRSSAENNGLPLPDDDMDRYLTNKASALRYPATPDIATAVGQRLASESVYKGKSSGKVPGVPYRQTRRTGVAVAFAVALVVLALIAVPQVRAFVGNLSVGIWRIIKSEPQPSVPGVPTVTPISPWDPRLVGETDLGNAIAQLGGTTLLPTYPADLGLPDHVFYQRDLNNMIIYVWMTPGQPDTPLLALYRFPDSISGTKTLASGSEIVTEIEKTVNNEVITETLKVGKDKATWIKGQYLFELNYLNDNGDISRHMGELIDGNTLVWGAEESSYSYKLVTSTHTTLDEALRIAESLQPLSPPPTPYPTTTPASPSSRLDLSGEVSYYEVNKLAGFTIKVPTLASMPELIAPDKLYLQGSPGSGNTVISVWYTPGRKDDLRMVMMQGKDEFMDSIDTTIETVVETTTVHGLPAQWVQGPQYMYTPVDMPKPSLRSLITGSHILIWQENGLLYRLETSLALPDAVAVAESLR